MSVITSRRIRGIGILDDPTDPTYALATARIGDVYSTRGVLSQAIYGTAQMMPATQDAQTQAERSELILRGGFALLTMLAAGGLKGPKKSRQKMGWGAYSLEMLGWGAVGFFQPYVGLGAGLIRGTTR